MLAGLDPRETREFSTLVDLLRWRALHQSERRTFTFLDDGEVEGPYLTNAELDRQARAIAAVLQSYRGSGERALLLYPPGLEFIPAFFGCLYAGVIAVPVHPPDPARLDRTLPRLLAIASDAQPLAVLTTSPILSMAQDMFALVPDLKAIRWLATDDVASDRAEKWRNPGTGSNTLAFLQYTSGSTAVPKGVMVSHGNLLQNLAYVYHLTGRPTPDSVEVTWAPTFHDMGLILGVIHPLYSGFTSLLMSPLSFLQQPLRWLQAISHYRYP